MQKEAAIIIGGGPCGLAAAIALQEAGIVPLVIEKGNIVNAIYNYPTHQTFFSSSDKLAIGNIPFITQDRKPKRNQALVYYREVVKLKGIRVNRFETVKKVNKTQNGFTVETNLRDYSTPYVVVATGYYDHANMMGIPGENLPKVHHYFKEGHPFFDTEVLVIGGKNSAVDAALELHKAGAHVTVAYRGDIYSPSIKPWVLPEFEGLVRTNGITMLFNTDVVEIKEKSVTLNTEGQHREISNDFVFAMTGYHPDHSFLEGMGVEIDPHTGRPSYHEETMETNVPDLFIAGVIAAGNNANEIFIENGRFHGEMIATSIIDKINGLPGQ
ncbi:YpdA family putative bacillithiol disulfide reductase [Chungangia koreensis]|uniref:YpdA family putative bacillithiol disulfide reductase n=1 Tax=Chungangia koreensis TaxID=752657 RepID=A0ABV8X6E5_9LACT